MNVSITSQSPAQSYELLGQPCTCNSQIATVMLWKASGPSVRQHSAQVGASVIYGNLLQPRAPKSFGLAAIPIARPVPGYGRSGAQQGVSHTPILFGRILAACQMAMLRPAHFRAFGSSMAPFTLFTFQINFSSAPR